MLFRPLVPRDMAARASVTRLVAFLVTFFKNISKLQPSPPRTPTSHRIARSRVSSMSDERTCGEDVDEVSFAEWLAGTSVRVVNRGGKDVKVLTTRVDIKRKADASASADARRRRRSSDNILLFTGRLVESFGSSKEMSFRSEKSASSPEASRNEPRAESTSVSTPSRRHRLISWVTACFRGSPSTRSLDASLESPSSSAPLDAVAADAVRALAADARDRNSDRASDDSRCDLHRWRACTRDYSITASNSLAESTRSTRSAPTMT